MPSMADDLDALGKRHRRLQQELEDVRAKLAPAMREAREAGETIGGVQQRSGYRSYEAVRQILDPKRREEFNRRRSQKKREDKQES